MFRLLPTSHFDRRIKKFTQAHPILNRKLAQILRDLEADPFQERLRIHPLKGEVHGLHAVTLTQSYRITLALKAAEKEIILLDIRGHDEVYR